MRAVRNTEEGVRVVDVPAPDGPGVRVRVRSAGICGSDLEMVRTGLAAGTLGPEIRGLPDDGTEGAVHPVVRCGASAQCRGGSAQLFRLTDTTHVGWFR